MALSSSKRLPKLLILRPLHFGGVAKNSVVLPFDICQATVHKTQEWLACIFDNPLRRKENAGRMVN